jgi:hypothetical protein
MSSDSTVRAMDTDSGREISVKTSQAANGEHVVLLEDGTTLPGHSIQLTHREAHQLAVYLLEQSSEAEMREIERHGDTLAAEASGWDLAAGAHLNGQASV